MAEQVTLTIPVTKPSQTTAKMERITIDIFAKSFFVQWQGENGEAASAVYSTPAPADHPSQPTGAALLTTMNKKNFSGGNASMIASLWARLIADGYLAGAVSGTPD